MEGFPFETWTDTNNVVITREAVQAALDANNYATESYEIFVGSRLNEDEEPADHAARRVAHFVKTWSDDPVDVDFGVQGIHILIEPFHYDDRLRMLAAIFLNKKTIWTRYAGSVAIAKKLMVGDQT